MKHGLCEDREQEDSSSCEGAGGRIGLEGDTRFNNAFHCVSPSIIFPWLKDERRDLYHVTLLGSYKSSF